MITRILKGIGGLVVAAAVLGIGFGAAMRRKYPPLQQAVRRMNRRVFNPRAMTTAGQPGAYASVIRHIGRASGTPYETPIQALPTEDGFVIGLPYGSSPDWLKNVRSAGSAVLVSEGNAYEVDGPRIVGADEADPYFSPADQRTHRLFGVDEFLRLRRVDQG